MGRFILTFLSICVEMAIAGVLLYLIGTNTLTDLSGQSRMIYSLIIFFGTAFELTLILYTIAKVFRNVFGIDQRYITATSVKSNTTRKEQK